MWKLEGPQETLRKALKDDEENVIRGGRKGHTRSVLVEQLAKLLPVVMWEREIVSIWLYRSPGRILKVLLGFS